MKVIEFIKALQDYETKADVMYTWESISGPIEVKNIYLSRDGEVVIDCDNNYYKKAIQRDGLR